MPLYLLTREQTTRGGTRKTGVRKKTVTSRASVCVQNLY
jgi:hypothetical protein